MITQEQIREQLVKAIKNSGLKQKEIAERAGVIQQAIAQYISGRAMPSIETFANICNTLELDANEILCIENKEIERHVTKKQAIIEAQRNHQLKPVAKPE